MWVLRFYPDCRSARTGSGSAVEAEKRIARKQCAEQRVSVISAVFASRDRQPGL